MSTLKNKDFHSPMNSATIRKIVGHLNKIQHEQAVAADATASVFVGGGPLKQSGVIEDIYFISSIVAGAGESMTIDVLRNGVSILTGVYTFNATAPNAPDKQVSFKSLLTPAGRALNVGDVITVTRDYTVGGTPTPMAHNAVVLEIGPSSNVD